MKLNNNSIFEGSFMLLIAIATNSEWQSNRIIWWSSILLFIMSCLFSNQGKIKFKLTYFKIWWFFFTIISIFSAFIALDSSLVFDQLKTIIIFDFIIFLLEDRLKNLKDIERVLFLFVLGILITLGYLLITFDLNQFQLAQTGHGQTGLWNGNDVALKSVIIVPILLYFIKKARKILKILIYLFFILISMKIIIMTGSRKGIVMLVLGIACFITMSNPKKIIKNGIIGIILIIISYLMVLQIPKLYELIGWRIEGMIAMFSGNKGIDSSSLLRKEYISLGVREFFKSPILGYGLNNYRVLNLVNTGHYTYSHNNFIEILVNLGIVGFLSYYWIYFYLVKKYLMNRKNNILIKVLFINFTLYFMMHYGFVSYDSLEQYLLILFLYSALKIKKQR